MQSRDSIIKKLTTPVNSSNLELLKKLVAKDISDIINSRTDRGFCPDRSKVVASVESYIRELNSYSVLPIENSIKISIAEEQNVPDYIIIDIKIYPTDYN